MQFAGEIPGACGNWHTPMKLRGNKRANPVDQRVAQIRPNCVTRCIGLMMRHAGSTRRENRQIDVAFTLNA